MNHQKFAGNLFVIACLVGAIICSYLLYFDIYVARNSHEGLEQAGMLIIKKANIQRKVSTSLIWDRLEAKEKVFWNDAIQSGKDSEALLILKGGVTFKLGESSLIELDRTGETLNLNIKGGTMAVDMSRVPAGTSMVINNRKVTPEESLNKKLTYDLDSKTGDLVSYRVSPYGTTWKTTIGRDGKTVDIPMSVSLESPDPMTRLQTNKMKLNVPFIWKTIKPLETVFEIALDKDFKKVIARQSTQKIKKASYEIKLPSGNYYWRVNYIENRTISSSETRRIQIDKKETNKLSLAGALPWLKAEPPKILPQAPLPSTAELLKEALKNAEKTPVVIPKPITIAAVKKPPTKAPMRAIASSPPIDVTWTVLVSVFQKEEEAAKRVSDLRGMGLSPYYAAKTMNNKTKFVVNVGLFNEKSEANSYLSKLRSKLQDSKNAFEVVKSE